MLNQYKNPLSSELFCIEGVVKGIRGENEEEKKVIQQFCNQNDTHISVSPSLVDIAKYIKKYISSTKLVDSLMDILNEILDFKIDMQASYGTVTNIDLKVYNPDGKFLYAFNSVETIAAYISAVCKNNCHALSDRPSPSASYKIRHTHQL